ncbi:MATE family efflux transporter [Miniphocaeibacter halophilus]|nr:MATE family efflux transporter [Miniphocaeibacter halophilus]
MDNKAMNKNITKSLLVFTIPLILSGLFQQLFNWVDAFIVGNVEGEMALAGIGATTSIYNLFVTVIIGFTSGLAVLSAQQYGRGLEKKIKTTLSSYSIILGGIFLIVSIIGVIFTNKILIIMNTPENIFSSAKSYMEIMLIGIPFLAIYNTYSAVLRGIGNSRAPFFSILVSSVSNVVLDILLVAVFSYGAAGAAIATVISQIAMTIFIIGYTRKNYPMLSFSFSDKNILNLDSFKEGTMFGLPPAIQSGVSSVGNVYLQQFMNGFGEQTVAAITTAYRVDSVIFLPIINFSSGIATIVAQNIGAGNKKRAKKVFKIGTIMMVFISLSLTFLVLILGKYLIAIFGLTAESVAIGKSFFYAIARFYLIYGLSMAIRGYLEGNGDMLFSGIVGILSLLVRIVCSYAFKPVFNNMVVAYAEAFSWIFLLTVFLLRLYQKNRKEKLET